MYSLACVVMLIIKASMMKFVFLSASTFTTISIINRRETYVIFYNITLQLFDLSNLIANRY